MVLLSDRVVSDGISSIHPKALPGAVVEYEAQVIYSGLLPLAADSLVLTNAVPAKMSLVVSDMTLGPAGAFAFVEGAVPSTLLCSVALLSDPADCIEFSADGGASFDYVPQPDANGSDARITHFRFRLRGAMAPAVAFPTSFTLLYRMKVN